MVVIGSVGSQSKLDFIKEKLGFDGGFNYKIGEPEAELSRVLKELGKEGVDIYYDNVGGEQLDAALALLNTFGRVGMRLLSPFPFPHELTTNSLLR